MTHALWVKLIDSVYFSNRVWKIIPTKMDSSCVWIAIFKVQMDLDAFNEYYVSLFKDVIIGSSQYFLNNGVPIKIGHVEWRATMSRIPSLVALLNGRLNVISTHYH